MKSHLVLAAAGLLWLLTALSAHADQVSDFQDITVGSDGTYTAPTITSGSVQYSGLTLSGPDANPYGDGFTVSNHSDTTYYGDSAYLHSYDAIPGSGSGGSTQYAVAYAYGDGFGNDSGATATLPANTNPVSIDITNTTYAYYSMLYGDSFAKKFGGPSGNDPDWFLLTITGYNASDALVGSVPFYLADFRFTNNAQDYIVSQWTTVDLSSLAGSQTLTFSLSSSDNDPIFGMNTPAFFAVDNLRFASASLPGDLNGDGVVNNFDISAFELALTDPSVFLLAYPAVTDYAQRGDINQDGSFNNFDIGPFESLLTGSSGAPLSAPVPEPPSLALTVIGIAVLAGRFLWRRRGVAN
jgi:hypothetical protein